MIEKPIVSVICLCYNHEKFVTEALDSIINQSYENIEIIIVDDCSSDDSVKNIKQWIQQHPDAIFIENDQNIGNTKSFNLAAKVAKGNFLIDFATDDLLVPDCIEKQISHFQNSTFKNLGLIYGNAALINENGQFMSYYFDVNEKGKTIEKRPTGEIFKNIIDSGKTICSVSAMISKPVFDSLQGYDENLAYEDLDFWMRLSRNFEIDYIDAVLVQKRMLYNSLGSQFFRKKRYSQKINHSTYLILKKIFGLIQNQSESKALLRRTHYEILLNCRSRNFSILLKLALLKLKIHWLILTKPHTF